MKVVIVTTMPESLRFFTNHIKYLKERNIEVHLVSSRGEPLEEISKQENIPVHAINMARHISPIFDLKSLAKLYRLFMVLKPTLVHACFPKGGLLGLIAARLASVPLVVYGMRGLRFETEEGLRRSILYFAEALTCRLAHRVICNSFSNRNRAISLGLCQADKIRVLAKGSSSGVDAEGRFNPHNLPTNSRFIIRDNYEIPRNALVVGYVGRIVRDKGIIELENAWKILSNSFKNIFLIMVGPIERHNPVPPNVLNSLKKHPKVRFVGLVKETAPFYAAMDLVVLPSYREGLPNTLLEAAAMELPVVATKVNGCIDAVMDEVTGILVPPRDSQALAVAIEKLIENPELRRKMGHAGRKWMLRDFKPKAVSQALYENYMELIQLRKI